MEQFTVRFTGDEADQETQAPRVPVIGETVIGPDDFGPFIVTDVWFEWARGFYYSPSSVIVWVRPP